jgi:hypothetical protein
MCPLQGVGRGRYVEPAILITLTFSANVPCHAFLFDQCLDVQVRVPSGGSRKKRCACGGPWKRSAAVAEAKGVKGGRRNETPGIHTVV